MKASGVPATGAGRGIALPPAVRVRLEGLRAAWPVALLGLSAIGYLLAAVVLVSRGIYGSGGVGGVDAWVYWSAADRSLHGQPLYALAYPYFGSFAYPPPFAQVLAPLSLLPFPVFLWLWRALELVCLRVAVGSWRNAGLALLLWPPVIAELDAGNVQLIVAAALARTIASDARWLAPTALVKFVPVMGFPLGWRLDRRGLLAAAAAVAVVVGLSALIDPQAWADYIGFLRTGSQPDDGQVLGGIPFALRLLVAIPLALLAAWRWPRLSVVSATLAYPILWMTSLSTLVALVAPSRGKAE